jgi:hypothetical protein
MQKKTQDLIEQLLPKWEQARSLQNIDVAKRDYGDTSFSTVNGSFSWNSPFMVMLCDFVSGGGYEESGSVVGLAKDGRLLWEYSSHCSCNGFDDSEIEGNLLIHEHVLEKKSYELESFPVDWEEQIQKSLETLINALQETADVNIRKSGNGFLIEVRDEHTHNTLAVTRKELELIVLYGTGILK